MEGRLAAGVTKSISRLERESASMEVMLDQYVFRRDGGAKRFPGNNTTAMAHTCIGVPFSVCVDLAPAPAISRFYLQWPGGPKPEAGRFCQIVAAHRGLLLLRFTSLFKSKTSPQDLQCADDYFVYTPVVSFGKPSLAHLPAWLSEKDREFYLRRQRERKEENIWKSRRTSSLFAEEDTPEVRRAEALTRERHEEQLALGVDVDQDIEPSSLIAENLGLVCSEDGDRFIVAELHRLYKTAMDQSGVYLAELSMFRSSDDGGPSSSWELKQLPVDYHPGLHCFEPQAVVPFDSCLCWVNYRRGMILAHDVLEHKSPKLSYVALPRSFTRSHLLEYERMHRGVCATDGGRLLKLVDVVSNNQQCLYEISFAIVTYTLTKTKDGCMEWARDAATPMTDKELWGLKAPAPVPHEVPMLPLVSMDKPHIIHFLLSELTDNIDTLTLVTVDMDDRTVLSVRPYIKGEQELCGEDADLARARSSFLEPFLPAEFPWFRYFLYTYIHLCQFY
ncbi:hypothetical protein HU200_011774 [Digitaria exilis]|uniref:DUF1618 domain-containing protein n=1 Tax=Digitaria exilis TaxID=1010633 RepID=A0A835FFB3_9POAL|nr:hypothetical protein HU200_011774 [Digitaria exilis]